MRKVVVDREEIEAARNTLANGGGAVGVLRWAESILAQPAEAEGAVEMGSDAWMALHLLDRLSVDSSDELRVMQIEGIVKSMGAALSAVTAERDRLLKDSERLDFMLSNTNRKVVAERIGGGFLEVYVEEGFMGDEQYPPVKHKGDWKNGSEAAKRVKRAAIDAAMSAKEA